ncbi:exported hypothetical protein [uncultured Gammaproteobacteria bacterium]
MKIPGLLWLLLLYAGTAVAQSPVDSAGALPLTTPVKRLQAFLNKTKTLEADFTQRIEEPEAGVPAESTGHIATAKPGRFHSIHSRISTSGAIDYPRFARDPEPLLAVKWIPPAVVRDNAHQLFLGIFAIFALLPFISVLAYLFEKGFHAIDWAFFTELPRPVGELHDTDRDAR